MNGTVLSSSSSCTTASTWALRICRSWAMRLRSWGCGAGGTAGTGCAGRAGSRGGAGAATADMPSFDEAGSGPVGSLGAAVSAVIVSELAGVTSLAVVVVASGTGSTAIGCDSSGSDVGSDGFIKVVPGYIAGRLRARAEV